MDRRTFTSLAVLKVFFVIYMLPTAVNELAEACTYLSQEGKLNKELADAIYYVEEGIQHVSFYTDVLIAGPSTLLEIIEYRFSNSSATSHPPRT